MFQYQKELNTTSLHFRHLWLNVQEDAHKKNAKKEAKEYLATSSSALAENSKDKGKFLMEGPEKV